MSNPGEGLARNREDWLLLATGILGALGWILLGTAVGVGLAILMGDVA